MTDWPYVWNEDWVAAWAAIVQAIGSLAAIYAAYMFASGEAKRAKEELEETRRKDREAQERAERERVERIMAMREAAIAIAEHAAIVLDAAADGVADGQHQLEVVAPGYRDQITLALQQMSAFPIQEVSDSQAIRYFVFAQSMLTGAQSALSTTINHRTFDAASRNTLNFALKKWHHDFMAELEALKNTLLAIKP